MRYVTSLLKEIKTLDFNMDAIKDIIENNEKNLEYFNKSQKVHSFDLCSFDLCSFDLCSFDIYGFKINLFTIINI